MVLNRGYVAKSFHCNKNRSVESSLGEFKPKEMKELSSQTMKAIQSILKSTLPDTINDIHIKYDLREVQSLVYYDQKDCILTLMPVEIKCENVAVSLRISPHTFPLDFGETSLVYEYLQKQVEEMLMMYIRNIKKWCGD